MSVSPPLVVIQALIQVILFLNNRASSSHLTAEDRGGAGKVLRSWSMVEKIHLDFPAFSVIMLEKYYFLARLGGS